ncbi:hypothetical protein STPL106120_02840 [Streptococcus pluranimalium]|uniref:hypothetical protein n=1 Tax=Streptococcus pluranimalium TaxID=82348 RepID=UPI0039E732C4
MKKIILLISLLAVTLNTSPALANQHSKFESKQTSTIFKNPRTKRELPKDFFIW